MLYAMDGIKRVISYVRRQSTHWYMFNTDLILTQLVLHVWTPDTSCFYITIHLCSWGFYPKWLTICAFNNMDTTPTPKVHESNTSTSNIKYTDLLHMPQSYTTRDKEIFFSWVNLQSDQVSFQSAFEDVWRFCSANVNEEFIPPLWSQDSKQSGLSRTVAGPPL